MKYSPKKFDTPIRVLYSSMLIISVVCMMINVSGLAKTLLSSVSLVLLACSLYLIIIYDSTSYEFILMERNGTLDFYVNKITGRRGAYVVYYPLTDCIECGKYESTTRAQLDEKYSHYRIFKYVQNFISSKEIYYAVFKNNDRYETVIFEGNAEFMALMTSYRGKCPSVSLHTEGDDSVSDEENQ